MWTTAITTTAIATAVTVGLLTFPFLLFLLMANTSTLEDTTNHLDLWQNTLDRYRISMYYHEDYPDTLAYVGNDLSVISTAESYGLDGHVGLDFLTYAMWIIDVRVAIEISGDVQLALHLADDVLNRFNFHRDQFTDIEFTFLEHQLTHISTAATRLQELLSNDSSNYMQYPNLIALIDESLNQMFVGYTSGLESWMINFLQDRVPEGTTNYEIYDFVIRRIIRLEAHSPGDWFLLREFPWR